VNIHDAQFALDSRPNTAAELRTVYRMVIAQPDGDVLADMLGVTA
jgi:hypothetical protein